MKKYIRIILSIVVILMFVGCGKKEKHEIEILTINKQEFSHPL